MSDNEQMSRRCQAKDWVPLPGESELRCTIEAFLYIFYVVVGFISGFYTSFRSFIQLPTIVSFAVSVYGQKLTKPFESVKLRLGGASIVIVASLPATRRRREIPETV